MFSDKNKSFVDGWKDGGTGICPYTILPTGFTPSN
jgi:hypothetical protein